MFRITPVKVSRVVVDAGNYEVKELGHDEAPPSEDDAVFLVEALDFGVAMRMPIGRADAGADADRWANFMGEVAQRKIVGWENVGMVRVVDDEEIEEPAEFDPAYLVNGTVDPNITSALCWWLVGKSKERKEEHQGKASGTTPSEKPDSGEATEESLPAPNATNNESTPEQE